MKLSISVIANDVSHYSVWPVIKILGAGAAKLYSPPKKW